jgi:hypothetical protein
VGEPIEDWNSGVELSVKYDASANVKITSIISIEKDNIALKDGGENDEISFIHPESFIRLVCRSHHASDNVLGGRASGSLCSVSNACGYCWILD